MQILIDLGQVLISMFWPRRGPNFTFFLSVRSQLALSDHPTVNLVSLPDWPDWPRLAFAIWGPDWPDWLAAPIGPIRWPTRLARLAGGPDCPITSPRLAPINCRVSRKCWQTLLEPPPGLQGWLHLCFPSSRPVCFLSKGTAARHIQPAFLSGKAMSKQAAAL